MAEKPTYEELEQQIQELEQAESERKSVCEELRFLSSIARQITYSIVVTDTNFRITYVNKATLDKFGTVKRRCLGKLLSL